LTIQNNLIEYKVKRIKLFKDLVGQHSSIDDKIAVDVHIIVWRKLNVLNVLTIRQRIISTVEDQGYAEA